MAVITTTPVQLNAWVLDPKISAPIIESRFFDTIKVAGWRQRLNAVAEKGYIPYGGGIFYRLFTDLPAEGITDFSKGENVYKQSRPKQVEVAIVMDTYTNYPISVTDVLTPQAFENGTMVNDYIEAAYALPGKAAEISWNNRVLAMLNSSVCVKENIDLNVTTTGSDGLADEFRAMKKAALAIQKVADAVGVYGNKYTNASTNQERDANELVFIYNSKYKNALQASLLAPLFNGEVMMNFANTEQAIGIPEVACDNYPNLKNMICLVTTWERFNMFHSYVTTGSFYNGYTLTNNTWRHMGGGFGEVDHFFATMFVDATPAPPPPTNP